MNNRGWLSKALSGLLAVGAVAAAGCAPSLNDPDYGPLTTTFAVSDYFAPSGFMGDGANPGYLTVDFKESNCKQPRPPNAQGRCYTFTYYCDPNGNMFWAGAYWVYPTNSWGARPGYVVDSTKFQQVRFWAALDLPNVITAAGGGNTFFNAIAGGINGKGFYGPAEHDDAFRAEEDFTVGTDVTSDFKQYHVSLANQPAFHEVIGAFAWSMPFPTDSCTCSVQVTSPLECVANGGKLNCPTPVTVHLDDIVWDTAPPPTP